MNENSISKVTKALEVMTRFVFDCSYIGEEHGIDFFLCERLWCNLNVDLRG